jgi:hypothetical protein
VVVVISRHSTSKQAAAGSIPEINIKRFFCILSLSSWYTLLLQQSSAHHLVQNVTAESMLLNEKKVTVSE